MERRRHLHYSKPYAIFLPIVAPATAALYYGLWDPWADTKGVPGAVLGLTPELQLAGVVCGVISLITALFYPSDGLLRGPLLGEWL